MTNTFGLKHFLFALVDCTVHSAHDFIGTHMCAQHTISLKTNDMKMKKNKPGNSSLYKIPSDAVIENRRIFYSLHKESTETICNWLNRLQISIVSCKLGQKSDFHLIDKFFSELNEEEICQLNRAKKWSVAKLAAIVFTDEKFGAKTHKSYKNNKIPTNAGHVQTAKTQTARKCAVKSRRSKASEQSSETSAKKAKISRLP